MKSDKVKIGFAFVLIVLAFSLVTLIFWDFVRDAIVVPIDYLIWVGGLVIRSIPQEVYLAAFLLISFVLSLNTLDRIRSKPAARSYEQAPSQADSRYYRWRMLVSKQSTSPFYRDIFVTEARNLILSMLAYDHGIDSTEAETRVRNGTLTVPEPIRNLIEKRDVRVQVQPVSRVQTLLRRLRLLDPETTSEPPLERFVAEVIDFVEQYGDHV